MIQALRAQLVMLVIFSALFGLFYPTAVWGFGRLFFPHQSRGSLIQQDGHIVGSELIGQPFESDRYFHSRPSATPMKPYNFMASGASNLNPAHPDLLRQVRKRVARLGYDTTSLPADLVTTSGSGLDPHISPESALLQAPRIALVRRLPPEKVRHLIETHSEFPTFGFLGQARVNVFQLNLALDRLAGTHR